MDHTGHAVVEQLAALILVIGGGIFVALSFRVRPVLRGPAHPIASTEPTVRGSLVAVMAWLSAGAAVIHLVAAPSHYAEIGDLAAGFVGAAAFQALWIRWCLAGPSPRAIAIGIAGNAGIVAAWAISRTIGLPGSAFPGPEPIGYPDSASVVFELLLIACLVARALDLDLRIARRPAARSLASVAIVPVIGIVLLLTSLASLAIVSGLEHGLPEGQPAAGHVAGH